MLRKICGGLLLAEAALILIGSIANGSLMSDYGSAAATYGRFVGTMIPVVADVLGGWFLLRFDRVYQMGYADGFRARSKQCTKIVWLLGVYAVAMMFAGIGAGAAGTRHFLPSFVVAVLPHLFPVIVFALMLGAYAVPYWACKKQIVSSEAAVEEYLSASKTFYTYIDDNSVLADSQVLFFPRLFVVVPFACIAAVKFYNAIEQDVIFTLTNGKKIEIAANKKQYQSVVTAMEAYAQ